MSLTNRCECCLHQIDVDKKICNRCANVLLRIAVVGSILAIVIASNLK